MSKDGPWLNVPQAVVLEATRDIELAVGLTDETPDLLLGKANQRVARRTEIAVAADADRATWLAAVEKFEGVKVAALADSRYLEAERRVYGHLIGGVRSKARRRPGGPYESVDPVEYTAVELQGIDAIDKRTRSVILFDLRINAVDLVEHLTGRPIRQAGTALSSTPNQTLEEAPQEIEKWECKGDPLPKLIEWARSRWGEDAQGLPNALGLLEVFRDQFGRISGINEKTMRPIRRELASSKMRRGGAPTHRR